MWVTQYLALFYITSIIYITVFHIIILFAINYDKDLFSYVCHLIKDCQAKIVGSLAIYHKTNIYNLTNFLCYSYS